MKYLKIILTLAVLYTTVGYASTVNIKLVCTNGIRLDMIIPDDVKQSSISMEGLPFLPFSHYEGTTDNPIAIFANKEYYIKTLIKIHEQKGRSEMFLLFRDRWIPCTSTKATQQ
ncbi:hypothetical protein GKR57_14070 [Providencia stuartii]|uniref:hypothetical protein n=1 Tax=Providencia stuartii TaxID=588 RepID=UPI0012B5FB9E|nr:hypothetical protein [Providencia stuartii]MTC20287.1 hypothetical protein [Providencia stuartii]